MSSSSGTVTEAHFRYIAERTAGDDPFLQELRRAAERAGLPTHCWVAPEQASLMQILLLAARAETVVEVGTLAGYSAIWMARALPPGGMVTAIEISERHAEFASAWIAKSDVADRVRVLQGDARELLPGLPSGSAGAVFIDADKAGYPAYLEQAHRLLRSGGLLMVDNAFAFGELLDPSPKDRETPAILRFNDLLAQDERFRSVIVAVGDGMWVGTRR
jgi:caffeoyl-CoA O-methyltransferase